MNTNELNSLIRDYKKLEKLSHVSLDDAINKVTQEVAELIEAYTLSDETEMYKEAWDVLVNVYSVAQELWLDLNFDLQNNLENQKNPINLAILNGKWNDKIQTLRWRYTRKEISTWEVQEITIELVREVLNYSDPDMDITDMIQRNISKFWPRVSEYKAKRL